MFEMKHIYTFLCLFLFSATAWSAVGDYCDAQTALA
ncbi:uncharacterized protein METZ01_LOCUS473763, partial [marine metagenome]